MEEIRVTTIGATKDQTSDRNRNSRSSMIRTMVIIVDVEMAVVMEVDAVVIEVVVVADIEVEDAEDDIKSLYKSLFFPPFVYYHYSFHRLLIFIFFLRRLE